MLRPSGDQLGEPYSVRTPRRLVRDVVWYYPEPLAEAVRIKNLLAFYNEGVQLEVDE
jgi:uncharacterized protein (DUF427 family)